jgi:hypothetical protein
MKRISAIFLLLALTLNSYTQIIFENGYFINNSGQRTECLIRNVDWKNNPVNFLYRLSEDSPTIKENIDSVMEFGVNDNSKFIRASVNIDRSSALSGDLSIERNPVYTGEVLFLKVLVEGKANLYSYEDVNLIRYFYRWDTSGISQLVYKLYKTEYSKVGINNDFRQQLWVNLKCEGITMPDIGKIEYKKNGLVDFFQKYNNCNASKPIISEPKKKKDLFNFSVRPGVCFSTILITNSAASRRNAAFRNRPGLITGLEAEFIMPFLKNKWSVILEPGFLFINTGKEIENGIYVEYKSLELPVGIRHYFFLNGKARIFLNASLNLNAPINSGVYFDNGAEFKIESMQNLLVGAGFKYKSNYSIEVRYGFKRDLLTKFVFWNADYSSFSVILGYTLF